MERQVDDLGVVILYLGTKQLQQDYISYSVLENSHRPCEPVSYSWVALGGFWRSGKHFAQAPKTRTSAFAKAGRAVHEGSTPVASYDSHRSICASMLCPAIRQ